MILLQLMILPTTYSVWLEVSGSKEQLTCKETLAQGALSSMHLALFACTAREALTMSLLSHKRGFSALIELLGLVP